MIFLLGGMFIFLKDVVRILCTSLFFSFWLHYPFVHWSCDHLFMTYIVFFSYIYDDVCSFSPIPLRVFSFHSLYTCFFMYAIFNFVSHYDALMSFV